ncbi:MAG: peptidoglycan recognition family protein [Candidatus Paceibacterota bacterium]|jgi:hypothetical protein
MDKTIRLVPFFLFLFFSIHTSLAKPAYPPNYPKHIVYAALHHTQVQFSTNSRQLNSVNEYHKERFGMQSSLGWYVGYNDFCDVDGTVTRTRRDGEETAAQLFHNLDTISFCMAGDFNIDMPTKPQIEAMKRWLKEHRFLKFKFHRELNGNGRTCPGSRITRAWIAKIMDDDSYDTSDNSKRKASTASDTIAIQNHQDYKTNVNIDSSGPRVSNKFYRETESEVINLRLKRALRMITEEETQRLDHLLHGHKKILDSK